jgi:hypothetical protein
MNIHHANPRERDAELFMEQLHRELATEERVAVRFTAPDEGCTTKRIFLASPAESASQAALFGETHDVYTEAAARREHDGPRAGATPLWEPWDDLDAGGGHARRHSYPRKEAS